MRAGGENGRSTPGRPGENAPEGHALCKIGQSVCTILLTAGSRAPYSDREMATRDDHVHDAASLAEAERAELVRLTARRAGKDGTTPSTIPFVSLLRASRPSPLRHGVLEPSMCLVVQGEKRMQVGADAIRYGAGSYAVAALDYPTSGQIVQASTRAPYLAVRVALDPREIADVIVEAGLALPAADAGAPVAIAHADRALLACVLRLVQLLDEPGHAAFLAHAARRELIYRLLRSDAGPRIYRSVRTSRGIGLAIEWLRAHVAEPIDIDALARTSRMSVSSLRHEFKAATALAPLQFQKQLRLQEARRLLLAGEVDAGEAAFRIGYHSASQFSREYRRMFGAPPIRDLRERAGEPAAL